MFVLLGNHFIKLKKPDAYKMVENSCTIENDIKKKLQNNLDREVSSLSCINFELSSVDIEVAKLVLNKRDIEYISDWFFFNL